MEIMQATQKKMMPLYSLLVDPHTLRLVDVCVFHELLNLGDNQETLADCIDIRESEIDATSTTASFADWSNTWTDQKLVSNRNI